MISEVTQGSHLRRRRGQRREEIKFKTCACPDQHFASFQISHPWSPELCST